MIAIKYFSIVLAVSLVIEAKLISLGFTETTSQSTTEGLVYNTDYYCTQAVQKEWAGKVLPLQFDFSQKENCINPVNSYYHDSSKNPGPAFRLSTQPLWKMECLVPLALPKSMNETLRSAIVVIAVDPNCQDSADYFSLYTTSELSGIIGFNKDNLKFRFAKHRDSNYLYGFRIGDDQVLTDAFLKDVPSLQLIDPIPIEEEFWKQWQL